MALIAAVANQIIADDLPVVFVDTCSLLDVIRSVKRNLRDCVAHASALYSAATAVPRRCNIVVSYLVRHEWRAHEGELLDEAAQHLVEMEEHSRHFHDACGALGVAPGFGRSNYAACNLATQLRDLSRMILDCAIVVDDDNECSAKAMDRVIYNVPPSKKGGEAKDCTILEGYLAVSRLLFDVGFQKKQVFCTSNKNDFCKAGKLHPILAAEFAPINLHFVTNLGWALHEVTN